MISLRRPASAPSGRRRATRLAVLALLSAGPAVTPGFTPLFAATTQPDVLPASFPWRAVASSADLAPGDTRPFNSFNQPSVNANGVVVFRAQSKAGSNGGEPVRGIYTRKMTTPPGPIQVVFDSRTVVPDPNNTLYNGTLGTFTQFPSFPRIGADSPTVVTRGQSKPVWTWTLPDGTETRAGSSGVYSSKLGTPRTVATQLGAVPGMEMWQVPGAPAGTRFDQFPGSPAVASATLFTFKGNYTDVVSKTGIYFRNIGPKAPGGAVQRVASSDTPIPGAPAGQTFGSTAPPSASANDVVFLGLDNEDAPTLGGIYRAPIASDPALQTVVGLNTHVPGEPVGTTFSLLGEALSYDGRNLAFWGAWGPERRQLTLICPTDGEASVIAYCNEQYPNGHVVDVPVHQGFFVQDVQTGTTRVVAKTGDTYLDFLYWTYSGRPPGTGGGDGGDDFEPPRWRSAAFAATGSAGARAQVAFKARTTATPAVDGIYLIVRPSTQTTPVTLVDTTTPGQTVDPAAPAGSVVTSVGLERDSLRDGWLTISAGMLEPVSGASWAGIYITRTKTK